MKKSDLRPGMTVRNRVSGRTGVVRGFEDGTLGYAAFCVGIRKQIASGKQAGRSGTSTTWSWFRSSSRPKAMLIHRGEGTSPTSPPNSNFLFYRIIRWIIRKFFMLIFIHGEDTYSSSWAKPSIKSL